MSNADGAMLNPGELKNHVRHCLLHEYIQGHSASSTTRKLNELYGKGTINDRTVQRWFSKFKQGDFSFEDKQRKGRPVDNNRTEIEQFMRDHPGVPHSEIAIKFGKSPATISRVKKLIVTNRKGGGNKAKKDAGRAKESVNNSANNNDNSDNDDDYEGEGNIKKRKTNDEKESDSPSRYQVENTKLEEKSSRSSQQNESPLVFHSSELNGYEGLDPVSKEPHLKESKEQVETTQIELPLSTKSKDQAQSEKIESTKNIQGSSQKIDSNNHHE